MSRMRMGLVRRGRASTPTKSITSGRIYLVSSRVSHHSPLSLREVYQHLTRSPGWFKALLPKSALTVEEEAWNSYPYTKTKYRCPFVDKLNLEIETLYFSDGGSQNNVFSLTGSDLREREMGELA